MRKLIEVAKVVEVFPSAARTVTGTLYNSDGSTGSGIDTQAFQDAVVQVNVGAVAAGSDVDISLVHADVNNASVATAISAEAKFETIDDSVANAQRLLSVNVGATKRYIWAKVDKTGTTAAVNYGINAILAGGAENPVVQTVDATV